MMNSTTAALGGALLGQGFFGVVKEAALVGWVSKTPKDTRRGSWQLDEVRKEYFIYLRLKRETDLLGRVVPRLHNSSSPEELVLERVQGRTLNALCIDPKLTPYVWAQALGAVSASIAALHAAGWIHGDCHGGNVLVSPSGAKLIDLSHAQAWEDWGDAAPRQAEEDRLKMLDQLATLCKQKGLPPWKLKMAYDILI